MDDNHYTVALFVDFAKAFDIIDYGHLIKVLTLQAYSTCSIQFHNFFLSIRTQIRS